MKIGDRVKTTPQYAKGMDVASFSGVITEINTRPTAIYEFWNGYYMATNKSHPTKKHTVATVKTDQGETRHLGIGWLMTV